MKDLISTSSGMHQQLLNCNSEEQNTTNLLCPMPYKMCPSPWQVLYRKRGCSIQASDLVAAAGVGAVAAVVVSVVVAELVVVAASAAAAAAVVLVVTMSATVQSVTAGESLLL